MEVDDKVIKIISNSIYNDVNQINTNNIIKETILNERYYLHTFPKDISKKINLILWF